MLCHFQKVNSHRVTVKTTIVQGYHNTIVVQKTRIPPLRKIRHLAESYFFKLRKLVEIPKKFLISLAA